MGRAPTRTKKTNDPAVIVDLIWRERVFYLVLANTSAQAMRAVDVSFRRKILGLGGAHDITKLPVWSKIGFLPAGKRIDVVIDRDDVFFAHNKTGPLTLTIAYTDPEDTRWQARISHDFESNRGFPDLRIR